MVQIAPPPPNTIRDKNISLQGKGLQNDCIPCEARLNVLLNECLFKKLLISSLSYWQRKQK